MVVVTGDAHCSMVADLKQNFDDPDSRTVGVEFLGTSITSGRTAPRWTPGASSGSPPTPK
jgi:phosphodiesterase/alkaline phosphatase D-like protein